MLGAVNYGPSFFDTYSKNQLLNAQSHYNLETSYAIKNNNYDKKNIPVCCFCKQGKTIETSETITVFAHGYMDTHRQAFSYIKNPHYDNDIITSDGLVTFDFADAGKEYLNLWRLKETSLAQENEMHRLHVVLKSIKKRAKKVRKIILLGTSRGASTIITTLARYPHPEVSAIILESPFAQFKDILDNMIKKPVVKSIPYIKEISTPLASFLIFRHAFNGITPLKAIQNLPKDLPILILATQKDALVPYASSQLLYDIFLKNGYTNVHFSLFNYGRHARLVMHEQATHIQKAVHIFYEKYNLPHSKEHTQK